jgi:hypothetical protein
MKDRSRTSPDTMERTTMNVRAHRTSIGTDLTHSSEARRLHGHGRLRRTSYRFAFTSRMNLLLHSIEVRQKNGVAPRHEAHVAECIREIVASFAGISARYRQTMCHMSRYRSAVHLKFIVSGCVSPCLASLLGTSSNCPSVDVRIRYKSAKRLPLCFEVALPSDEC